MTDHNGAPQREDMRKANGQLANEQAVAARP